MFKHVWFNSIIPIITNINVSACSMPMHGPSFIPSARLARISFLKLVPTEVFSAQIFCRHGGRMRRNVFCVEGTYMKMSCLVCYVLISLQQINFCVFLRNGLWETLTININKPAPKSLWVLYPSTIPGHGSFAAGSARSPSRCFFSAKSKPSIHIYI